MYGRGVAGGGVQMAPNFADPTIKMQKNFSQLEI